MANIKIGRPLTFKKSFHIKDLLARSKNGECITEICASWDISRQTFYVWSKKYNQFNDAIKKAESLREKWWIEIGKAAMLDQATYKGKQIKVNLGYFVWLTKNILKWNDRTVLEEDKKPRNYVPPSSMIDDDKTPKTD